MAIARKWPCRVYANGSSGASQTCGPMIEAAQGSSNQQAVSNR